MPAIPSALAQRLRDTLAQHPALADDRELRAIFIDARLALWINHAPENTTGRANRVAALINALCHQTDTNGSNALVLFLRTLADQTNPTDALHPALLTLAAELATQPPAALTPLPFPPEAEGETLIVIAAFHRSAGIIDTEPHKKIRRAIEKAREKAGFADLRVVIDPASLEADDRAGAATLGDRYDATLIIWGEDTGVEVCVNFYNRKQPDFAAASVRIEETTRTQIAAPSECAKFITRDLPDQLAFLSLFAVGQSYNAAEAYTASAQAIETAVAHLDASPAIAGAAEAYFRLGWLYSVPLPDADKALANYTQTIALNPQLAQAYSNRGNIYADLQQYDAALADYAQAIALNPQDATAYYNRGNTYHILQQYNAALADYAQAIALNPQLAQAYSNRGNTYRNLQQYDAALADYAQAIALNPQLAQAYYNRGNTYATLQQCDAALADYAQAIALNPQYTQAYSNRGTTYAVLQQYDAALADYAQAIALNPQLAQAYYNRGITYHTLQQYDAALTDFNRAIELNPQDAQAYYNRGNTYAALQQYNAALVDYTRALELDPQDAQAYYNRGTTYAALQQYDAALANYAQAIALNPQYAQAYSNRGTTYVALQQYDAALADYAQAIALNPQLAQAYYNRGFTYHILQQYDAALADYAQAIALNPQYATAYYNTACAHALQSHTAEACTWLEKAIALNPESRDDALTDSDFDPIRDASCFQALVNP